MNTDQYILTNLLAAAASYDTSLLAFRPWGHQRGTTNNIIAERNISFHFARSFTNMMASGIAFMERPFKLSSQASRSSRLDAYMFSTELAIMLEVKTFFDRTEAGGILQDIARVDCKHAKQHQQGHPQILPLDTRGLVIAETWKLHVRKWWTEAPPMSVHPRFNPAHTTTLNSYKKNGWHFGEIFVGSYMVANGSKKADCYWLYCYSPICICASAPQRASENLPGSCTSSIQQRVEENRD